MLHPLNHGPNPNIPQLCSHCYPFSYNDCSRRVWTSRKDLFKKYGEIFEMFIEKMMVNPPYTWDASLFGPSQNRMQSSWPALQRRGLHTPWPCLPGMRSRRGCMRLKKNNSYNILQLYFIHQMQSQIETKNQSYD